MLKLLNQRYKTNIFFQQVKVRCLLRKRNFTFLANDYGAGNKGKRRKNKKISDILKKEVLPLPAAVFIGLWAKKSKSKNFLELGTSLGFTALTVAQVSGSRVYTIEADRNTYRYARAVAKIFECQKVHFYNAKFEDLLPELLINQNFDIIFIDGNHTYDATVSFFKKILQYQTCGTQIIFDDINWSGGMKKAWKEIKAHKKVKVILNLHRFAIIKLINQ